MQQEYVVLQEAGHQAKALLESMRAAQAELQGQLQQQDEQQCQDMTAEQVAALVDDIDFGPCLLVDDAGTAAAAPAAAPAKSTGSKPLQDRLSGGANDTAHLTSTVRSTECLLLLTPLLQGLELQHEMLVSRASHQLNCSARPTLSNLQHKPAGKSSNVPSIRSGVGTEVAAAETVAACITLT
jgi:hypothetical protein